MRIFTPSITIILLITVLPRMAVAQTTSPQLVIAQAKVTSSNGQFITLYNTTDITLDMSKFQLQYFNNYDLSKSTSNRLVALSGQLPAHGYYLVSDDEQLLCYQMVVSSVSLGFSSTAGMVEVVTNAQSGSGSSVQSTLLDYVAWSKTAASGAQTLPTLSGAFLQRQPVDLQNSPAVSSAGSGTWQQVIPDATNVCNLDVVVSGNASTTIAPIGFSQLLPSLEPPVSFISVADSTDDAATPATGLPAADVGLLSPRITELLPNPAGSGNDSTDEYIELYNPNVGSFDLSGFILTTGTTTTHRYTFSAGSSLSGQSFTAFFSGDTGLSLSNGGSQAVLFDPTGTSVATTDAYGTAKDGQAWALGNGRWYWTTQPTPGTQNVIAQPVSTKKASKKSGSTLVKLNSSTKSATKLGSASRSAKSASLATLPSTAEAANVSQGLPLQPWLLALFGGAAVLYGAYEYRADLANRFHEFRRNPRLGRRRGGTIEGGRGD